MKIFLTGATGFVGSSLVTALADAGHEVTALVRSQEKADQVARDGVTTVVADMRDQDVVRRLAGEADAVVATASPGDASSADADTDFVDAVLAGIRPGSTFIRTGGVWVHGSGADVTEETPIDAPSLTAWRQPIDERALHAEGIRSILVEPGIVYGHGTGIPTTVVGAEQTDGDEPALQLVGPGTQHWTTVHVDDLAELYVAALTRGEAGDRFLGVSGDNPTVRELGEAASRRRGLDGRVQAESADATTERLGAFGEALLLDQQATGEKARRVLGWTPTRPSLVEEIESGGYDQD